ncbi:protein hapless 2 [Anaeramoeba flamelloides]|uniref:Protein hapless 2 n=1 Tax=Anaeramoeba flamelloides TaxID=1746091 RepID=A0ABQ8XTV9_9EUKA|nr:protein hapless 2 [Anaeramoeba flamelloides]
MEIYEILKSNFGSDLRRYKDTLQEGCNDDEFAVNPTCGWDRDNTNEVIKYSQGYCCTCSLVQSIEGSYNNSRSMNDCKSGGNETSSAHCLEFGGVVYGGYSVGKRETIFNISLEITKYNYLSESFENEIIWVSSATTTKYAQGLDFVVKLIGDFTSFQNQEDFENKYFFLPVAPLENSRVQNYLQNSIILDQEFVDLDGFSCNKIGITYETFQKEANACLKGIGSCVNRQLEYYHREDNDLRNQGLTGKYFIENFDNFEGLISIGDPNNESNINKYLNFKINQIQNPLLYFSINADDIELIDNRAFGIIQDTWADDFESQLKEVSINVKITNLDEVTGSYSFMITECTNDIASKEIENIEVLTQSYKEIVVTVNSVNDISQTDSCFIKLYDSYQYLIHTAKLYFDGSHSIQNITRNVPETFEQVTKSPTVSNNCNQCSGFNTGICRLFKGCLFENVITILDLFNILFYIAILIISVIITYENLNRFYKKRNNKFTDKLGSLLLVLEILDQKPIFDFFNLDYFLQIENTIQDINNYILENNISIRKKQLLKNHKTLLNKNFDQFYTWVYQKKKKLFLLKRKIVTKKFNNERMAINNMNDNRNNIAIHNNNNSSSNSNYKDVDDEDNNKNNNINNNKINISNNNGISIKDNRYNEQNFYYLIIKSTKIESIKEFGPLFSLFGVLVNIEPNHYRFIVTKKYNKIYKKFDIKKKKYINRYPPQKLPVNLCIIDLTELEVKKYISKTEVKYCINMKPKKII